MIVDIRSYIDYFMLNLVTNYIGSSFKLIRHSFRAHVRIVVTFPILLPHSKYGQTIIKQITQFDQFLTYLSTNKALPTGNAFKNWFKSISLLQFNLVPDT